MSKIPRKPFSVGDRVEFYSSTAQRSWPGEIVELIENERLVSVVFNCAGRHCRKLLSMSSPDLVAVGAETEADNDCSHSEDECDPDVSFAIKPSISEDDANELQEEIQAIFHQFYTQAGYDQPDSVYPPVVISYATGMRGDDGKGAGPGLMWAQSLQKALFEEGIPSFTGLLIKGGMDWKKFQLRIARRGKPMCKVMIAMLSKAYFNSFACLDEVALAASTEVPVLPLRFEDPLPDTQEWWPNNEDRRELQVAEAIRALRNNCEPARGVFAASHFKKLVKDLRERFVGEVGHTILCVLTQAWISSDLGMSSISCSSIAKRSDDERSPLGNKSSQMNCTSSASSDPKLAGSRRSLPEALCKADVLVVYSDRHPDLDTLLDPRHMLRTLDLEVSVQFISNLPELRAVCHVVDPAIVIIEPTASGSIPWEHPATGRPLDFPEELTEFIVDFLINPFRPKWRGCILNFQSTASLAENLCEHQAPYLSLAAWTAEPGESDRRRLQTYLFHNLVAADFAARSDKREAFCHAMQLTLKHYEQELFFTAPSNSLSCQVDATSDATTRRLRFQAQFQSCAEARPSKVREVTQPSQPQAKHVFVEAHLHTEPEVEQPTGPMTEELLRSLEHSCTKLVPAPLQQEMTYLGKGSLRVSMSLECFEYLQDHVNSSNRNQKYVYLDLPTGWGAGEVRVASVDLGRNFYWDVVATVAEVDEVLSATLSVAKSASAARKEETRQQDSAEVEGASQARKLVTLSISKLSNDDLLVSCVTLSGRTMGSIRIFSSEIVAGLETLLATYLQWADVEIFDESGAACKNTMVAQHSSLIATEGRIGKLCQTLKVSEDKLGTEHPETLRIADNLAIAFRDFCYFQEAEALLRQTLKVREAKLGPEDRETLTNAESLAMILQGRGEFSEAKDLLGHALKVREREFGLEHPETLTTAERLAMVLTDWADIIGASLLNFLLRQTPKVSEAKPGREHPEALRIADNLAIAFENCVLFEEAEALLRQTLKVTEVKLGPEDPQTLTTAERLAVVLQDKGDFSEAEDLLRHALKVRKR
eukprot:TRINITY_DN3264_c0_g2_i2.p1 TRINITY_DN3264_c0_g2~~TRINITY_DN3264_c0_g2_i2.p1  ORF type:complete len:1048 (+),score=194.42 TRINITY_DN3264_c0_g2_i2:117-3260(+)